MELVLRDVRYGLRRLIGSPLFTTVAVLSLALGIGANTAIFSVVNSLLLRDLAVASPQNLVNIYTSDDNGIVYATSSYPDYEDLRQSATVFDGVLAHELFLAQAERDETTSMVMGELVSGNFFSVLGLNAVLGRTFAPEETAVPGRNPVAVLGDAYWRRAFNADPGVIGRTVQLNRRAYTVIGVLAPQFKGMYPMVDTDMYLPMMMANDLNPAGSDRLTTRGSRSLFLVGRLKPGVSLAQAGVAVGAISARLEKQYPESNTARRMSLVPSSSVAIHPAVDRALYPVAGLLLAVVGLVLLIACANLASFLLARATDRRREIAVRLSLGAHRWQLVRQLVVESILLSLLGGVAAVLLAQWALRLLTSFQPPLPIPVHLNVGIDSHVLLFTLAISIVAGIAFGLAPGLQATRADMSSVLRDEAGGVIGGRRRVTLRGALVVAQMAVSVLLLVGAGLFLRSLDKAQRIDPGFDIGPAAILWPQLDMSGFDDKSGPPVQRQLVDALRALPGVTGVALADRLPLGAAIQTENISVDGVQPPPGQKTWDVDFTHVDGAYFDLLHIPLMAGRVFTDADGAGTARVAVISEAAARQFWPGGDAVGQIFYLGRTRDTPVRVVGVVRDTKVRTLGEAPRPYFYLNSAQTYIPSMMFVLHGSLPAPQLVAAAQRTALAINPRIVIMEAKTMEQHLALLLYPPRMAALLLSVFGGLALLLAAVGLYGMVSYAVARRTREVGIRAALGASQRDVVGLLTGGGVKLIGVGCAIGLALAAALTWLLSGFLYGVHATDALTFLAVPALLGGVGVLASWVPARRAAHVDPMHALRTE